MRPRTQKTPSIARPWVVWIQSRGTCQPASHAAMLPCQSASQHSRIPASIRGALAVGFALRCSLPCINHHLGPRQSCLMCGAVFVRMCSRLCRLQAHAAPLEIDCQTSSMASLAGFQRARALGLRPSRQVAPFVKPAHTETPASVHYDGHLTS